MQRFIDDDDGAQELATEGKSLIRRERRKMEKSGGTLANRRHSPMAARRSGAAGTSRIGGRVDDGDEEEGRAGYTRTKGAIAGAKGSFGGKGATAVAAAAGGAKGSKGATTTAAAAAASSDSSSGSTKQSTSA